MDAAGTHDGYKITVTLRHKRFALIGVGLVCLGLAAALVLNAFQSNLVFFFTPTQVAQGDALLPPTGESILQRLQLELRGTDQPALLEL